MLATETKVEIVILDRCKYESLSKVVARTELVIDDYEVKTISDQEIYEQGFDEVDPYQEYLIISYSDGRKGTFRNSFVDMFRV